MSTETSDVAETRWCCPSCGRTFRRAGQPHSCHVVALEDHLPAGHPMRPVFDHLLAEVHARTGACEIVALPCCVHLKGREDFVAVLPRKRYLQVRFSLDRELDDPRIRRSAQISRTTFKHVVEVADAADVDEQLLDWLAEAHDLTPG